MHLNRKSIPKTWLISKKEHPYIHAQKSSTKKEFSLSLAVILRDMLKITRNFKETKKAIRADNIKVNGKSVKNEKFGVGLFDIVEIDKLNKSYILIINESNDLELKETKDNKRKISKVVGKKVQNNGHIQINLMGGLNLLTKEKINVNDSVIVNQEKKIEKVLPLKKEAHVFITAGKWVGKIGKIELIKKNKLDLLISNKKVLDIPTKNIIVVDKENLW